MERIKKFLNDKMYGSSLWLFSNSLLLTGCGFIFWTIAARLFSSQDVGLATTLLSCAELIGMMSLLGFNVALLRYLPEKKDPKSIINSCFTLSALVAAAAGVVFLLALPVISPKLSFVQDHALFAILFVLFVIIQSLFLLVESVLIASGQPRTVVLKNAVFGILKIAFLFVFIGAIGIFVSWGISALIGLFFALWFGRIRYKISLKRNVIKSMFKVSSGNYLAQLFGTMPALILPLLITHFINPQTTAYFYVTLMIASVLFFVPDAIAMPLIAHSAKDQTMLKQNVRKAFFLCFTLIGIGILCISLLGGHLLLFFGEEYRSNGVALLILLSLSAIPLSISTMFVAIQNVRRKMHRVVAIYAASATLLIVLSLLLLPYGITGIGFAWLIARSCVALAVLYHFLRRGLLA